MSNLLLFLILNIFATQVFGYSFQLHSFLSDLFIQNQTLFHKQARSQLQSSSQPLPPPELTKINCSTNPSLPENFFDSCQKDTTREQIPTSLASTFWSFFNGDAYSIYLTLFILILSFLPSKYFAPFLDFSRLHAIFLLFQIGWVDALDPFLYVVFRQDRPCICTFTTGKSSITYQIGSEWGMPSGDVLAATIFALHFARKDRKKIPLILLFISCAIAERMILGFHSLGQALSGAALGFVLHSYFSYTPLFFRAFDIIVNVVAGIITIHFIHPSYPEVNFGFASGIFNGYIWMFLSIALLFILYPNLLKFFPKQSIHGYYSPHILQGYYLYLGSLGFPTRILDPNSTYEQPKFLSSRTSSSAVNDPLLDSYGAVSRDRSFNGSFGFGGDGGDNFYGTSYDFDSVDAPSSDITPPDERESKIQKRFFSSEEVGRAFPPELDRGRYLLLCSSLFFLFFELAAVRWASPYISSQI